MAKKPTYDVNPRSKKQPGNWEVKKEGGERASSVHDTKPEAVGRGRELAEERKGQLRIKKKDGTIEEERTYRKDPNPPPG